MQKLLHLEDELHQRVIGQDEAVTAVAEAVMRARSGLKDPEPAHRQLHFSGAHGRGQDRTGARAGGIPVRRRAGHDPHRHVRISGKAHRGAADRRASRIRRLRRRRAANGSRAAASVLGGAVRRNREGAPRRVQRDAADSGRWAPHRWARPHRGLQEHHRDHDFQHRAATRILEYRGDFRAARATSA